MPLLAHIFPRKLWDAIAAKWVTKHPGLPVKEVFIHHGATHTTLDLKDRDGDGIPDNEEAVWRAYQKHHMTSRGWSDIAYNFGVGKSGSVLEGRGWERQGGATGSPWDRRSLSICAIGNFQDSSAPLPMVYAIANWIITGMELGYIHPDAEILGHLDGPGGTACPGRHLYKMIPAIRTAVAVGRFPEEDTMEGPISTWHEFLLKAPDYTKSEAVRVMQLSLWQWGFLDLTEIDGIIGPRTRAAHKDWAAEEFPKLTFLTDRPSAQTWSALIAGPPPEVVQVPVIEEVVPQGVRDGVFQAYNAIDWQA